MSGLGIMRRRAALAMSVVALFGVTTYAAGQVPTSSQRIKISKDTAKGVTRTAGGEVALETTARHDDSIRAEQRALDSALSAMSRARLMRQTERRIASIRAKAREDSAAREEARLLDLKLGLMRGYYVAIAGGMSSPQRALRDGYTGGWNVTVPVGYDATNAPFGVRMDVSVDHLNGTRVHNLSEQTLAASGDLTVWSLNTDLKLRLHAPGLGNRTHFYLLGGLGAHRVTGGVYGTTSARAGENVSFNDAKTRLGWNAGGGLATKWGPAEVFVESRFFQVKTDLPFHQAGGVGTYTSFTPVMLGVQWF